MGRPVYSVFITIFRDPTTRHLFYLQLRSDLLKDRLQATSSQGTSLACLALQAEWGDNDHPALSNHGYFQPEHYVSGRLLRAMGTVYVRETLPGLHRQHRGLTDSEAEFRFIKVSRQLFFV